MARNTTKKVTTVAEVPEVKLPSLEKEAVIKEAVKEEEPVEKVEEKEEPKKETVTVEIPELKEEPPVLPKNVKIRLTRNHRCVIGSKLWVFEQGKVYTVPEDVKERLKKAELLDAI